MYLVYSEGLFSETTRPHNRCFSYTALLTCFNHSFIQGVHLRTEPRHTASDGLTFPHI